MPPPTSEPLLVALKSLTFIASSPTALYSPLGGVLAPTPCDVAPLPQVLCMLLINVVGYVVMNTQISAQTQRVDDLFRYASTSSTQQAC